MRMICQIHKQTKNPQRDQLKMIEYIQYNITKKEKIIHIYLKECKLPHAEERKKNSLLSRDVYFWPFDVA